ncbi:MAG: gamma-glutamyl-gamma-aminobutyrate hydrolase family protein [Phycisphaerales bacterium]
MKPLIGITVDVAEAGGVGGAVRAQCALAYSREIAAAGGVPVMLAPVVEMVPAYVGRCDGFVLTGGDDPRMEEFGAPTHPKATPVHAMRQAFEVALLRGLEGDENKPVLGVCLGMQMMALCAGGRLNQHMPDDVPTAGDHAKNSGHRVKPVGSGAVRLVEGEVTSHHRQAVSDAGRLRVIAAAPDGVIEAIDDPARGFYVGVQWHPERTRQRELGAGLIEQFVRACAVNRKA